MSHDDNCCHSPQTAFTIRNDDGEPLASDRPITITLPSGFISAEGMTEIRDYLLYQNAYGSYYLACVAYEVEAMDNRWQASTGNFTKRLSSHAYQRHAIKLPPEILARVGSIAREHSTPVDMNIEVTRQLNLSSGAFGNNGSCWWSNYYQSRCALKTNGGFGLRAFCDGAVAGRAWVMPLRQRDKRLTPTFDTMTPSAFMAFNCYGTLSGYVAARVISHLAGWTYRKINFYCEPMFVNGNSGYLIAPEPVTHAHASSGLTLTLSRHASLFAAEQAERDTPIVA